MLMCCKLFKYKLKFKLCAFTSACSTCYERGDYTRYTISLNLAILYIDHIYKYKYITVIYFIVLYYNMLND